MNKTKKGNRWGMRLFCRSRLFRYHSGRRLREWKHLFGPDLAETKFVSGYVGWILV